MKCPISFFYTPPSVTHRLLPLPGAIKRRSGPTSFVHKGQLRKSMLNPVTYWEVWEVLGKNAQEPCIPVAWQQNWSLLSWREKGSYSDSGSKQNLQDWESRNYKNHQAPSQSSMSFTPSPGFPLSFRDSVSWSTGWPQTCWAPRMTLNFWPPASTGSAVLAGSTTEEKAKLCTANKHSPQPTMPWPWETV